MGRRVDQHLVAPGPFRADQIREGDPYELSRGHAIFTPPSGQRHGRSNLVGGAALESDPLVGSAGVDVGVSPAPEELRAPDISVGNVEDRPGWASSAPPLAVEYVDAQRDEKDLALKIGELFRAGTRYVWVVRLSGVRRVEIHEPGEPMRTVHAGSLLSAPGVLKNPLPIEALYDRDAAHEATFRNLLERKGYADLAAVREEGREEGREEALRGALAALLLSRALPPSEEERARIAGCKDAKRLERWIVRAATAPTVGEALEG